MAAAEARAAWQRTANRYFVQEDAKRAPKLACYQSSTSCKPVDTGTADPADACENSTQSFMPVKRSPSSANLPPDLRWWLERQPNYGYQTGLTNEQLRALDIEIESFKSSGVFSAGAQNVVDPFKKDSDCTPLKGSFSSESSADCIEARATTTNIRTDLDIKKQEFKKHFGEESRDLSDMSSYYEVLDVDSDGSSAGKQQAAKLGLDYESAWIRAQKAEPWWRTADGDELASLVLQKSLDHVDNCDLPPPQNTSLGSNSMGQFGYFGGKRAVTSPLIGKNRNDGLADLAIEMQNNLNIATPRAVQRASIERPRVYSNSAPSNSSVHEDMKDMLQQMSQTDPSKAELLEALCHSQTRAREAEEAAHQANLEKEHIMKLFFRQASHLFAYKQWFKLLQLEELYLHLKTKNNPLSSLFPPTLPWMPYKTRKQRKSWQKQGSRSKRSKGSKQSRFWSCKYGLAVAVGLGLVGAGLLLGWTVGWLFPLF